MKIEEENENRANKTLKPNDRQPTGEGEPGPEAGTPQKESCKVVSLDEYRSRRKNSKASEA